MWINIMCIAEGTNISEAHAASIFRVKWTFLKERK
jgi:hypothetical protein